MDLGQQLRAALAKIAGKVVDERAVKELVQDIYRALILADVNIELARQITQQIERRSLKEKAQVGVTMREHVLRIVYEELVKLMGEGKKIQLKKQKIMILGLFGQAKTTTAAKLALYLKQKGLSVGLICADVSRPAALEQLQQLAQKVGCECYGEKGVSAWEIVSSGLKRIKSDVIIVDTSGRNALDQELIDELKRVNSVLLPDEKILVVSADIGQIAKRQAEEFHKAVGITGIIITKMDGSGKGGGALSAAAAAGVQTAFIGTGEKIDDFEEFNPERFVGRLLGMPDIASIVEKAKKVAQVAAAAKKLELEKFTIENFYAQLKVVRQLGPLKGIAQSFGLDLPKELLEQSEQKFQRHEAAIASMTKAERENPELLRKAPSRIERIARGAGLSTSEVNSFVSEYFKMKKLFELLQKDTGLQRKLGRFLGIGNWKLESLN